MAALNYIIQITQASIVLSSTWRETAPQRRAVDQQLAKHGIPQAVDATPRLSTLDGGRAAEILAWAASSAAGSSCWVAIDDMELDAQLPAGHFVHTDPAAGLTMAEAERVCALLQQQAMQHAQRAADGDMSATQRTSRTEPEQGAVG